MSTVKLEAAAAAVVWCSISGGGGGGGGGVRGVKRCFLHVSAVVVVVVWHRMHLFAAASEMSDNLRVKSLDAFEN